ncbi:rapamycin-insensitive companion of mTOR [Dermacentor albipictus]|uniref:rapamycin-insensitive companion of mTOR n=1 Tax=Dermacentor albipictus TaxID=60249 RepID=UPI0031FDAF9A
MAHVMFRQRSSRGGRSLRRRHDSEEETVHLDLSKGVADNLREVLIYLVRQDGSKQRKIAYLNCLVKLSPKITPETELGLTLEDLFCCLRVLLVHDASEVRAGCLRALRHLVRDIDAARALAASHIPRLVARALDAALESRTERLQALRLVRRLVAVAPLELPAQLARSLVAVAADGAKETDDLVRACLATICELALLNPKLCVDTGGFRTLLQSVLDCHHPPLAEAMLGIIFHSINDPATRQLLSRDIDLEYLVAPFTDSHFKYAPDTPENNLGYDKVLRFQSSRIAMTSVLRSWPGMVYFCKPPPSGLQSLVEVLCLPLPDTRKNIIELLYDVFCLRIPEWTSDFETALKSADRTAIRESWKLYEGFVVAEACDLLPPPSKHRSNLVGNYLALLLLAFVQAGILEALVEVIVSSEDALAIQATILLAELLYMASIYLPSEAGRHCHCLPTLMSQAAAFGSPQEKRIRASTAVARLSHLHANRRKGTMPSSLFLDQLLQFCSPTKHRSGNQDFCEAAGKVRLNACLRKETDESAMHSIRDSQVLVREYNSWDWYLVSSLLKWPSESLRALSESTHRTFIRRLVFFYKPSSRQFSLMETKRECANQIITVGCQLFEFLLEADEGRATEFIEDFLIDLCNCLHEAQLPGAAMSALLGPSRMLAMVSHAYFLFIGRLASSSKGSRLLERLGVYQHIVTLVTLEGHDLYLKLALASMDYTKPGFARSLLTTALTTKCEEARLYATKFLRVLLRLELLDFRKWVMELLVTQLCDPNRAVMLTAASILDEACDVKENLEALIALRPVLLSFGDRGLLLHIRFLSVPSGFKYMLEAELLGHQLRQWDEVDNLRYVKIVEDAISQAVTWHQRGEDGTYGRRSSNTRLKVQDVFAPPHLYGQLVQHKEGLEYLQKHGCLERHCETVISGDMSNEESLLRLKASLWTVGHVGTSPEGFALVADADVLPSIVRMAQESPVYSIRGVCFYVLCLLASTGDSVEHLSGLGWDCVQHKHNDAWPVASDALRAVQTSPPPLRAHTWSISSAGSQQSEVLTASALHRRFHGSAASSLSCVDAGETMLRRTLNFVSEQAKSQVENNSGVRHSQTLPRNVTLSPRHDALVASSRRPRSSSDCRPGEARHDAEGQAPQGQAHKIPEAVAIHPSVAECRLLSVPDSTKERSSSFGGSRDSGTETSFTEKTSSNPEVKGERSDSNESAITTGTSKSRSDSCTDSTTSGVSSCDENAATTRTVQTLSPIASSTSLSTLGGNRGDGAVMPRRPGGFVGGVRALSRSSTSTSPVSPDSPVLMYTSARDVAGYATLRAVREASSMRRRRKRVCSVGCDGAEQHGELFSPLSLVGWSLDRSGFYIGEEPYPDDATSIRTMSMSSTASAATARSSARRSEERFMGLCLPVDTALIFSVYDQVQPSMGGNGEDKITELAENVEERSDGFELHTPRECLLCHSIERVAKMKQRHIDSPEKPVSPVGTVSPTIEEHCSVDLRDAAIGAFPFSRSSQTRKNRKSGERSADSDYDPIAVRRELLKYIVNLNSSVVMKGSEQALLTLKQKYPSAFQDVCLYSEVCLLMSRYRYRLGARTLLQELFFDLSLEKQFFEEAECILRIPHVVVMPPKEESEA